MDNNNNKVKEIKMQKDNYRIINFFDMEHKYNCLKYNCLRWSSFSKMRSLVINNKMLRKTHKSKMRVINNIKCDMN